MASSKWKLPNFSQIKTNEQQKSYYKALGKGKEIKQTKLKDHKVVSVQTLFIIFFFPLFLSLFFVFTKSTYNTDYKKVDFFKFCGFFVFY